MSYPPEPKPTNPFNVILGVSVFLMVTAMLVSTVWIFVTAFNMGDKKEACAGITYFHDGKDRCFGAMLEKEKK